MEYIIINRVDNLPMYADLRFPSYDEAWDAAQPLFADGMDVEVQEIEGNVSFQDELDLTFA